MHKIYHPRESLPHMEYYSSSTPGGSNLEYYSKNGSEWKIVKNFTKSEIVKNLTIRLVKNLTSVGRIFQIWKQLPKMGYHSRLGRNCKKWKIIPYLEGITKNGKSWKNCKKLEKMEDCSKNVKVYQIWKELEKMERYSRTVKFLQKWKDIPDLPFPVKFGRLFQNC
jgi:hypothetical protein